MAIWQFQCNIIPSRKNINELSYGEKILWHDTADLEIEIDFLKCEKSWSKSIVQYGNIDETCMQFFYEKMKYIVQGGLHVSEMV